MAHLLSSYMEATKETVGAVGNTFLLLYVRHHDSCIMHGAVEQLAWYKDVKIALDQMMKNLEKASPAIKPIMNQVISVLFALHCLEGPKWVSATPYQIHQNGKPSNRHVLIASFVQRKVWNR